MHQAQDLPPMRPALAPSPTVFLPTRRARLDRCADVPSCARERRPGQGAAARETDERWEGLLPWQVKRVRELVDADLNAQLSLSRAACRARLSPSYFSRCFRRTFGMTFSRFVASRRVERAKGLMTDGAGKLSEIAIACGFSDQAHFTRTFGNFMGCTPARWRRQAASTRRLV